jgi:eukaryotic-like serine/threonine-protein kinase
MEVVSYARVQIGQTFGSYQILATVGKGGMGEVYRARDTRLGRDVALKILAAAYTQDPDRIRRFRQEATAASALNHPE